MINWVLNISYFISIPYFLYILRRCLWLRGCVMICTSVTYLPVPRETNKFFVCSILFLSRVYSHFDILFLLGFTVENSLQNTRQWFGWELQYKVFYYLYILYVLRKKNFSKLLEYSFVEADFINLYDYWWIPRYCWYSLDHCYNCICNKKRHLLSLDIPPIQSMLVWAHHVCNTKQLVLSTGLGSFRWLISCLSSS